MITRDQFVAAVESLIGTPVKHMGRAPRIGLDCVGVPLAAVRLCGVDAPEPPPYSRRPSEDELSAGLSRYCDKIPIDEVMRGDILQTCVGSVARHVHVVTGTNECGQIMTVHAWLRSRIVQRSMPLGRVVAVWRCREVRG